MEGISSTIRARLAKAPAPLLTAIAGAAGFTAYFSMYAFRKPFTAASFEGVGTGMLALDYKSALVLAQVLGYAISKMLGVRVVAEAQPERRARIILALVGLSWLALLLFAIVPAPWNIAAMFLNGLPLGMIWGLVFSFMEGRRSTELLGSILCASFILSSGVTKSVGGLLIGDGISAFWMPFAAGALFVPVLCVAVWILSLLPPPSERDIRERAYRAPMNHAQRSAFLSTYGVSLIPLIAAYMLLTTVRDFRDNFAAELWHAMGFGQVASVFAASEVPVALATLVALAALMAVRGNVRALFIGHAMILAGFILLGCATLAFTVGLLSPLGWMVLAGGGLYLAYTPYNAILFDRMVAAGGQPGSASFLITLADACGYVASVALLLLHDFTSGSHDWLGFFIQASILASLIGVILTLASGGFLLRRFAKPAGGRCPLSCGIALALPR